jgi:hypothetical protein
MLYNQPYGVSDPNAAYINGNPSTGTMGSIPPAASIEYPQREIVNLIAATGRAPSNGDLFQLGRSIQSGLLIASDDTGTANAYACALNPAPTAYNKYLTVVIQIANGNTGPSVLNVNSLGNKPIVRADGTALQGNEMKTGNIFAFVYDGSAFRIAWPLTYTLGGLVLLQAPLDLYVNAATGNDSTLDGRNPTSIGSGHGPYRTIGRSMQEVIKYNLNGFSISVHVADGGYTENVTCPAINGSGSVNIIGNHANPSNCTNTAAAGSTFNIAPFGNYYIDGFRVSAPLLSGGDPGSGILCQKNGTVTIGALDCGVCRSSHIEGSGSIGVVGPIRIFGGAFQHCMAALAGVIAHSTTPTPYPPPTMSIMNAVTFSNAFIYATEIGMFYGWYQSITGAGNVTGAKYNVSLNALLWTNSQGVNYFPGSSPGVVSTGGQYS